MNQFWMDPAWITTAATAICSVCAAVASLSLAIKNQRKTAQIKKILEDAADRQTYAVCPHCKKKVYLRDLAFHLPDGSLDMNLDGKPDEDPAEASH